MQIPSRNHKCPVSEIYFCLVCKTRNFLLIACKNYHQFECCQKLESSTANTKRMKIQPASHLQTKVTQLRHHRFNLPPHKRKDKKRKLPHQSGQSQAISSQTQHKCILQKAFKPLLACAKPQNNNEDLLNCSKYGDTGHRPGLVDAQEVCQLQLFSKSPCTIQNIISDCSTVDGVNNDSDKSEPFCMCQI